jgi:hypothetical protein
MRLESPPRRNSQYVWFKLNFILGLLPPVHWALAGYFAPFFGMRVTLWYFLVLCTSIALSVMFTYAHESAYRGQK